MTLDVTLAQRTGRTVTTARAEAGGACTGLRQAVTLRVDASASFRPGRASISTCLRLQNGPCQTGTPILLDLVRPGH